jgi:hypothetical protein
VLAFDETEALKLLKIDCVAGEITEQSRSSVAAWLPCSGLPVPDISSQVDFMQALT